MGVYIYTAREITTNKKVRGEIELESKEQVKKYLVNKYMYPVSIDKKGALNSDLGDLAIFQTQIKTKDLAFFCKQFAAMIHAGISIARGLEICEEQCISKRLKKHLKSIHNEVTSGKTLSEAIKGEGVFPPVLESMIECGETAGKLDLVLNKVVEHFDSQLGVSKKIKKALTYPALVFIGIIVAVIFIMIKVVPSFTMLLDETGAEMPLATKIVMAISNFMVAHWLIIIIAFIVLGVGAYIFKSLPQGQRILDRLSIKIPIFGPLNKKSLAATFTSTFSMLVEAGIPMLNAVEITKKVVNNTVAGEELDEASNRLKRGSSLYEALQGSRIYPPIMFSMINIGEETGALDEMLVKISAYFKEEVDLAVDTLTTFIEPVLTILMAGMIGIILMATILPTFSAAMAVM